MSSMNSTFEVRGAEAIQRKLKEAGPKARAAARVGMRKAGSFAVKSLRVAAPQQPHNKQSTGATKKALGYKETVNKSYTDDGLFIGILRDAVYRITKNAKNEDFAKSKLKKGESASGIITKRPVLYAYEFEKQGNRNAWFFPTWKRISGQVKNMMIKEIYNAVDAIKKGN